MIALAYLAVLGGALLVIAGVTGSSVTSTAQGKPDRSNAGGPSSVPGAPGAAGTGEAAGVTGAVLAGPPSTAAGSNILRAAITQLGVPYRWGGEKAKVEFDCSGLVQWAFGQAGVSLPRTAAQQFQATHRISPGEAHAGDLVFFTNGREVSHVGIVVKPGTMIDAPHTGAVVKYESFPVPIGSAWGSDRVAGYGRA